MNLNEPKDITFIIAAVIVFLGLIGFLATIPVITDFAFWLVLLGYLLLAAGNMVKDL